MGSGFREYLLDRSQYVSINGLHSDLLPVLSGVSTGRIIRPMLFLIYASYLPQSILHANLLIFADDTKYFLPIASPQDSINLQGDLDAIALWSLQWKLSFNHTKFVHLIFYKGMVQFGTFSIMDQAITKNSSHKDLGVTFCSNPTEESNITWPQRHTNFWGYSISILVSQHQLRPRKHFTSHYFLQGRHCLRGHFTSHYFLQG